MEYSIWERLTPEEQKLWEKIKKENQPRLDEMLASIPYEENKINLRHVFAHQLWEEECLQEFNKKRKKTK